MSDLKGVFWRNRNYETLVMEETTLSRNPSLDGVPCSTSFFVPSVSGSSIHRPTCQSMEGDEASRYWQEAESRLIEIEKNDFQASQTLSESSGLNRDACIASEPNDSRSQKELWASFIKQFYRNCIVSLPMLGAVQRGEQLIRQWLELSVCFIT